MRNARTNRSGRGPGATLAAATTLLLLQIVLAVVFAPPVQAGDPTPFSARAGLDLALDAAKIWAADARLIYLENDEDIRSDGTAERWGYLFYSPQRDEARGYSVRDGEIEEAADLGFDFPAPPLPEEWVDSQVALDVAEKEAGRDYRSESGGTLGTMLLIRGALNEDEPDKAAWALVYTSADQPTLVVVVDAAEGNVIRIWKG